MKLTPYEVLQMACTYMGISHAEVRSKRRKRSYTDARALFACYCKEYPVFPNLTLGSLGEMINRDHSSISWYQKAPERDYFFKAQYKAFKQFVKHFQHQLIAIMNDIKDLINYHEWRLEVFTFHLQAVETYPTLEHQQEIRDKAKKWIGLKIQFHETKLAELKNKLKHEIKIL